MVLYERGYDIVLFEGPGQGRVLAEQQVPLTPDWHKPVKAVLDYFKLDDVTLIGISMGGFMVLEAAAFEPRVRRAIAWDILFSSFNIWLGKLQPAERALVKTLYRLHAAPVLNALMGVCPHTPLNASSLSCFRVKAFYFSFYGKERLNSFSP